LKNSVINGTSKGYTFQNTETKATSKTMTQQYSNTFGVKVAVEVGGGVSVPFFANAEAKVTTETSYSYEAMKSESGTDTDTYTLQWSVTGTLAPGTATHCTASAFSGTFDGDYTSTVEIKLADGTTFTIQQPGHFESTGWSRAISECKDIPLSKLRMRRMRCNRVARNVR